jgi:hypothetical protein
MPIPRGAVGELLVEFDVDSTGHVINFVFQRTKDGNYNKKLEERLRSTKFRPGVSATGVPIRAKAQITISLSGGR